MKIASRVWPFFFVLFIGLPVPSYSKSPDQPAKAKPAPASNRMAAIPAGTFMMGCSQGDPDCEEDEKPLHQVRLGGFSIDVMEVTNGQYNKCVKAEACKQQEYDKDPGVSGAHQPVVGVGWTDAVAYCRWAGKRLPTEAEWEYAARAGTTGPRYGPLDEIGWYQINAEGRLQPVAQKKSNPWGLYDTLGNAWEWVADWYNKDYYSRSPAGNPKGPPIYISRVIRGASYVHEAAKVRVSDRYRFGPDYRSNTIGFRCAKGRRI